VGVPRSGTTLVQSLLAAHPSVTSFTESHFFDRHFTRLPLLSTPLLTRSPVPRLREFLAENGEAPPEAAGWFEGPGRGVVNVRALLPFQTRAVAVRLLRLLDELAGRRGRPVWIEKTPRHLRYVSFLEKLSAPERRTHFVHVIRDGLEVVASLHQASQSWERPYDLDTCVRRWNADVGLSCSRVTAPNDRFVFYEELTAEPEATLRRLFADLDLDWEPGILERYGPVSRGLVTGEEVWKDGVGRSIRPAGTSRRSLTEDERVRVRRSLRPGLYEQVREGVRRRSGTGRRAG
jgi:hypothetical protein